MDLDREDSSILMELQLDGRVTNAELAERINLSPSACHRRVRRLESEGVIERYVALVDRQLVKRGVSVFVEISLERQREELLDAFERSIREIPNVMSCHLMAGNSDYLVHMTCADVADYETVHREYLAVLPGVIQIRTNFAIRKVVDSTVIALASNEVRS